MIYIICSATRINTTLPSEEINDINEVTITHAHTLVVVVAGAVYFAVELCEIQSDMCNTNLVLYLEQLFVVVVVRQEDVEKQSAAAMVMWIDHE